MRWGGGAADDDSWNSHKPRLIFHATITKLRRCARLAGHGQGPTCHDKVNDIYATVNLSGANKSIGFVLENAVNTEGKRLKSGHDSTPPPLPRPGTESTAGPPSFLTAIDSFSLPASPPFPPLLSGPDALCFYDFRRQERSNQRSAAQGSAGPDQARPGPTRSALRYGGATGQRYSPNHALREHELLDVGHKVRCFLAQAPRRLMALGAPYCVLLHGLKVAWRLRG